MKLKWFLGALALCSGVAIAQDVTQVTDCSNGCTIITCDQQMCAVNIREGATWKIATTYANPAAQADGEVRYQAPQQQQAASEAAPPAPSDKGFVLSPTSAGFQLAKVCKDENNADCSFYGVSVNGAVALAHPQ